MSAESQDIARLAGAIRRRVFAQVLEDGGGYLSQALSSADILALLYGRVLKLGPLAGSPVPQPFNGVPGQGGQAGSGARFNGAPSATRDRFLLSPAHYAIVLYSALIESGRLAPDAMAHFNADGSTVEMIGAEHSPGFETTTGSLAQALSQAAGIALARRMKDEPGGTWVMMSDGEFQEGQTWEALSFAAFHGLDRLRVVIDANGQQCDGRMSDVGSVEPFRDRIAAFGWDAREVDGHDLPSLEEAMTAPADAPVAVIARTDPAYLVPELHDRAPLLHSVRFTDDSDRDRFRQAYERFGGDH